MEPQARPPVPVPPHIPQPASTTDDQPLVLGATFLEPLGPIT